MSRCDIRIDFDNPDRTYRGGETVTGHVHISVNKDTVSNGVVLTHYWKTHGRGNTNAGTRHEITLSESVALQAGEELHLPFEFEADNHPLTYRGHYINVDHYVHVAVDVSWAIDPKHEEEFIVLPGTRPAEFSGSRSEIIEIAGTTTQASGIAKIFLFGILAFLLVTLSVVFIFLIPVFLFAGACFWVWKKMIASRVGEVTLVTPHAVVAPGEQWPAELSFTPRKTFPVNGITLRILAKEAATSGSGTKSTTHHHTLYDQTHTLHPAGTLMAGELFSERFSVALPDTGDWTLKTSDNQVKWTAEMRIDIPRFPDWSRKIDLQMVPPEFVDAPESDAAVSGAAVLHTSTTRSQASTSPVFESARSGDDSAGESMTPLLALLNEIASAGRFGSERSEIVQAATGHTYDLTVVVDRVATTFDFPGGDARYETGRTVIGRIADTDHEVQLFAVRDSNASLDDVARNEVWQTLATVESWDSLYNRLVMYELPFD